jgi:hypothetical protein
MVVKQKNAERHRKQGAPLMRFMKFNASAFISLALCGIYLASLGLQKRTRTNTVSLC